MVGQVVGPVIGKVALKAAKKGIEKGILATRKAYQAIRNSKTISEYFDKLRKFNKSSLESGLLKTGKNVSEKNHTMPMKKGLI